MTYAETAQLYVDAGWPVPFPLPAGRKHPPPDGVTGQHGEDWSQSAVNMREDAQPHRGNYGLRMPEGVMGLDVDQYGDKHGADLLAELEGRLGVLPAGPWSSSRAWPSGIRFFRVPEGVRLRGAIPGGIEIIQRHHRYAVVWPSVVEGREYHWDDTRTEDQDVEPRKLRPTWGEMPEVSALPELPQAWLEWLQEGASEATGPGAGPQAVADLEAVLFAREGVCSEVAGLLADADSRMAEAAEGGRHDAMTGLAFRLAHLCAEGHLSWGSGSSHLTMLWDRYVGDDRQRYSELARIMRTALGKVGPELAQADPCSIFSGVAPAPQQPGDMIAQAVQDASPSSTEVAGVSVFDPMNAYDDRALGLAVLAHVGGGIRYLTDAGGWLHRGPEAWTVRSSSLSEGARSCVAVAVRTLPRGRADAEDGSDEKTRANRHKTLTSTAGLNRTASWVAAEVSAAGNPLGIRLADLDAEPEQLWAGGVAWDLRASTEAPVRADVDPGTPHVRTAAAWPQGVPTPLWDAFCAAVWPDPEQRAWALRVLGIAVTGYADRALPMLWGKKGRGKTQVLALVSDVLGNYAVAADPRLLGSGEHHGSVTLALAGARLAWIDEGPRNGHWATERLKALTGGGEMTGNPMRGNPVTFRPSHTLCLTSNDEPQVADEALRSRVRSIECSGSVEAVRAARLAIGNLRSGPWVAERPGVLARLMAQAAAWLADPKSSDNPLAVEATLERMAREQDPVLAWLDDRTAAGRWTPAAVLYEDFRVWCARSGIDGRKVPNLVHWGRSMTAAGVLHKRGSAGVVRDRYLHSGGSSSPEPTGPQPGAASAFLSGDAGSVGKTAPSVGNSVGGSVEGNVGLTRGSVGSAQLTPSFTSDLVNIKAYSIKEIVQGEPEVFGLPTHPAREDESDGTDEREDAGEAAGDAEPVAEGQDAGRGPAVAEQLDPDQGGLGGLREVLPADRQHADLGADLAQAPGTSRGPGGEGLGDGEGTADPDQADGLTQGLPAVVVRDPEGLRTLHAGIDQVAGLLGTLAGQSVTLDVEHSGYPIGHPDYRLRTIQLGPTDSAAFAVVLDAADPEQVDLAARTLDQAAEIVAHASQADVIPVALAAEAVYEGVITDGSSLTDGWWPKVTDTAILGALADPHLTGTDRGHALDVKGLSERLLPAPVSPQADKDRSAYFRSQKWLTNTEATTPAARSGWAQADYSTDVMATYAAGDVLDTAALRHALPDPSTAPGLLPRERRVLAQVARISEHGLKLDGEWTLAKHAEATQAKAGLAAELADMGVADPASTAKLSARFAELGADLKRTKTGQLSTDKKALAAVVHQDGPVGDLARKLTAWRDRDTVLKLLLTPYRELVVRGDGRVRPTVQTLGAAATGRMSTVRPNLQQVSKVGGIRGCIVADPGHLLISADFSSVEVRVAAAVSGDAQLAGMIANGLDMHGRIASLVWGGGFTKAQRYAIKSVVFAQMYGSGKTALAAQLGPDGHRVDDVLEAMAEIMPGFTQWAERLKTEVRRGLRPAWHHPSGRLTYLPSDTPHKAPNYVIQSTARELLLDALERWEAVRPGHVLLPIHDEILVQVPEDQAEQATADLVEAMTTEVAGVPIAAGAAEPSARWLDAA